MSEIIANSVRLNRFSSDIYKRLTATIEQAVRARICPAVGLAVFHQDEPYLDAAWGWIDPETKQFPVQTSMAFDLASVTNLYTTTAFLSLVSEEKVTLTTPLIDILPEFSHSNPRPVIHMPNAMRDDVAEPVSAGFSFDSSQVNFRHLLTHTSGLPEWTSIYANVVPPVAPDLQDPVSRRDRWATVLEQAVQVDFVGQPDDVVRYSDIGFMLLGEAVSRLHGTPGQLEQAIQARVLKKGFHHTVFNPLQNRYRRYDVVPTESDTVWRKRRVWGEVHDKNACAAGGVAGHAGLFAPAFEVASFGNLWLNHGVPYFNLDDELWQAATELQAASQTEARGLGWRLNALRDSSAGSKFHKDSYGHTGFTGTSLWIDPHASFVVALLTNRVYTGREKEGIHELRRNVHHILYDGAAKP